jgi:hypothetical protein
LIEISVRSPPNVPLPRLEKIAEPSEKLADNRVVAVVIPAALSVPTIVNDPPASKVTMQVEKPLPQDDVDVPLVKSNVPELTAESNPELMRSIIELIPAFVTLSELPEVFANEKLPPVPLNEMLSAVAVKEARQVNASATANPMTILVGFIPLLPQFAEIHLTAFRSQSN